jgi:hypothetical protein
MAKLKPWYQVVTPREDLRQNRALEASEFAVHLDHIRTGVASVPKDYSDPARFFERTYLTQSLMELASQLARRLNGMQLETSAVFNMATQFGGGKTHSLTALYHLARGGDAAMKWQGVDRILTKAQVKSLPVAKTATFVGTEFDPLSGRSQPGEPLRRTPWGEIAWQLGGAEAFAKVAQHDEKKVAPAGDVIREMLPSGPVLILMDELLNYVSKGRKIGMRDEFYNFLQALSEEARARTNMVLCVSIPASELEMNPDDQRDHDSIKKLCDRVGRAIMMSSDKEMSEIIRRRLFEWDTISSDGLETCKRYAEWASEHSQQLVGIDRDAVLDQFKSCYPFHPSVISVFERKWQSLPRFQRTRGVLRLLALWVANNYNAEHRDATKEPLISLGLAPLHDATFRAALFEQLGSSELEAPVTADIAGKSAASHSIKLDSEASDAIKKAHLHQKVATAIFFESNGGQSQARAEASVAEIRTGVCGPDVNLTDIDTVLEGLANSCFYLQWDRTRYRFGLSPNLNQILVTRRGGIQAKSIDERIRKQTDAVFRKTSTDATKLLQPPILFPKKSGDVDQAAKLTLVVFGTEYPHGDRTTAALAEEIVRNHGSSGRTLKTALLIAVPDPSENLSERAREVLAWEDIDDDEETKKRVDEIQREQLKRNLTSAKRALDEAIFRAYRYIYYLNSSNKVEAIDLGNITSSSAGCLVELYLQKLGSNGGRDEVVDSVTPRKLITCWPASSKEWSTKAVRDAFFSSPALPRLIRPDEVKRIIATGVSQKLIGYASRDGKGNLKLTSPRHGLLDADIEISDDVFILKAEDAQKLEEPPRLAKLVIRPEQATIKPTDKQTFSCGGIDQYDQPIPLDKVSWNASVGTIDGSGVFTPSGETGSFNVKAQAAGLEAFAEVRVVSAEEIVVPPPPPGEQLVRWRGTVTPQKWMNFYTKVLSKFANLPNLRIEVSCEVRLPREQAEAKAAEAKTGLRELAMDDRVTVD